MKLSLKRILRGSQNELLTNLRSIAQESFRVEDVKGKVLFGDPDLRGQVHEVNHDGELLGRVVGGSAAELVAQMLEHSASKEAEKRALANETLERYKELNLLYDLSASLSEVLTVDAVAERVVTAAHGFLNGSCTALLLRTHGDSTRVIMCEPPDALETPPDELLEVERRVLETGRAELFQSEAGAILSAPLKDSRQVFGLLRARHDDPEAWSAAELKVVTSLAATAAGAVSHAILHQGQLEEQARRGDIERFISPDLISTAVADGAKRAVVVFCDLARATALGRSVDPEDVLRVTDQARRKALQALIGSGATVNLTQNDMLVAVFAAESDEVCAQGATAAARYIKKLISQVDPMGFMNDIGIGVSMTGSMESGVFFDGVERAAQLQAESHGRILIDEELSAFVDALPVTGEFENANPIFEVEV